MFKIHNFNYPKERIGLMIGWLMAIISAIGLIILLVPVNKSVVEYNNLKHDIYKDTQHHKNSDEYANSKIREYKMRNLRLISDSLDATIKVAFLFLIFLITSILLVIGLKKRYASFVFSWLIVMSVSLFYVAVLIYMYVGPGILLIIPLVLFGYIFKIVFSIFRNFDKTTQQQQHDEETLTNAVTLPNNNNRNNNNSNSNSSNNHRNAQLNVHTPPPPPPPPYETTITM